MVFKVILYYILGYVKINVEGYFIERFMNICKSKKILLWNVKRENTSIMHANIGIPEFKELKQIASKTKCKIKIENKRGVPFLLHKYKKRKIFFGFLIIMLLLIIQMSHFIWNIEIKGNTTIPKEEILRDVTEAGLTVGKKKKELDSKKIINGIRLKRNDIAWIGISLKGTNAVVEVVEADKKPDIINESEYCNVIASQNAEIIKVDAATGTALVQPGDIIKQGSILIGGWIEGKFTGVRYVHAKGEVKGKVWYTERVKVDLKQTIKEETGNVEKKYKLNFNNKQINLYATFSKFENYETIEEERNLRISSDFYLPIGIIEYTNKEVKEKQIEYSKEEAKEKAKEIAENKLKEQIGEKEIQNKTINFYETDNSVEAEVTYETIEEIGQKEKIVF